MALLEATGPVVLVLALLTPLIGLLAAVDMAVAIYLVKRNECFMKPDGTG